jgi:hypothetical protein
VRISQDDRPGAAAGPGMRAAALVRLAFVLAVAAGLLLRFVDASRKSLWLDELHSLWCAWGESLSDVLARVKPDLHPPLYFLTLHVFRALDPEVLRAHSILAWLATVPFLLSLARAAGLSKLARWTTCALFATAPYQVQYSTELRAYAVLQLCAVVLVWAAFTTETSARLRFVLFVAATAIGLYHHYYAALAVVAVGIARLPFFPWSRTEGLLRLRTLVLAGALGFLLFLPWILFDERWLLTDPGRLWRSEKLDTPEGTNPTNYLGKGVLKQDLRPAVLALPRLYVPMMASLGPEVARVVQTAAAVFFGAVAAGLLTLARGLARGARAARPAFRPTLWGVLAAGAAAYGIVLFLCVYFWRRVPLQYFVVAAWAWPLAAAALVDAPAGRRGRAALAAVLVASSAVLGLGHELGRSREDLRAAVKLALEESDRRGALRTAMLWQPEWYPHLLPFMAYAPDAGAIPPKEIPRADGPDAKPVIVVSRRKLPYDWEAIEGGRYLARTWQIDAATFVFLYEPE